MRRYLSLFALAAVIAGATRVAVAQDAGTPASDDGADLLERLDESLKSLVQRVAPAVVRVDVDRSVRLRVVAGSPLEKKRVEDALRRYSPSESVTATGFVVDAEGHVVTTAAAVGPDADRVRVTFALGGETEARFVGTDDIAGVAVVRVELPEGLDPLDYADGSPRVGAMTVLLAHAGRRDPVVRWGLLSGTNRAVGGYDAYLLSSVDVRPGDAGGPLVDVRGRVLGMAVMSGRGESVGGRLTDVVGRMRRAEDPVSIATFVPAAELSRIVTDLSENGHVRRGMLGVLLEDEWQSAGDGSGALLSRGVGPGQVSETPEGLPAVTAGVKVGDTIVAVDGTPVTDRRSMVCWIQRRPPGTAVTITLRSIEGDERDVEVILGELPSAPRMPAALFNGLGVRSEAETGLRIQTVEPGSAAHRAGILPGDVILSIAGIPIGNDNDYVSVATGPIAQRHEAEVVVLRDGERRTVTLK